MKVKVSYWYTSGLNGYGKGETVFELPDTGFIDQYNEFGRQMRELAANSLYDDLYDVTLVEEKRS